VRHQSAGLHDFARKTEFSDTQQRLVLNCCNSSSTVRPFGSTAQRCICLLNTDPCTCQEHLLLSKRFAASCMPTSRQLWRVCPDLLKRRKCPRAIILGAMHVPDDHYCRCCILVSLRPDAHSNHAPAGPCVRGTSLNACFPVQPKLITLTTLLRCYQTSWYHMFDAAVHNTCVQSRFQHERAHSQGIYCTL
jgi:hypothetical protein